MDRVQRWSNNFIHLEDMTGVDEVEEVVPLGVGDSVLCVCVWLV